jgi:hypothetical protein
MAKLTLTDITSGHGSAELHNNNNASIETAIENTLSRDGTSPNQMNADLDMNGYGLLNVASWDTDWNVRGTWTTTTAYAVGDVVYVDVGDSATYGGGSYYAQTAHTSGTFDTDFGSGYWVQVAARGATGASGGLEASNNLSDLDNLTTALNNLITAHGPLETADIGDDQITVAKIADGTDGELITWDSSGEATTIAVGTSGQVLTSNGAGAEPTWQTSSSTAASQAEMEAATSTTTMVTPGRQHYHPGMAKAWAMVNSSGTVVAGYNVASASNSSGLYQINFTNAMSSANYCVQCIADFNGSLVEATTQIASKTATYVRAHNINDSGTRSSATYMYFVVYGDQ